MTSTKNSHGLPMAIRNDCRLPDSSGGRAPRLVGGAPGRSPGCTRRPLTRLAASESLPLPIGETDLRSPFSFPSFLLLPEWLLPVEGTKIQFTNVLILKKAS